MKKLITILLGTLVLFSCQKSKCDNGKQDKHEDGIDCGGKCKPCYPAGESTGPNPNNSSYYFTFRIDGGSPITCAGENLDCYSYVDGSDTVLHLASAFHSNNIAYYAMLNIVLNNKTIGTYQVNNEVDEEDDDLNLFFWDVVNDIVYANYFTDYSLSPRSFNITYYNYSIGSISGNIPLLYLVDEVNQDTLTLTDGKFNLKF